MGSSKFSLSFEGATEYRIFQLLPVVRDIDSSEADRLIAQSPNTRNLLSRYPDGTRSVVPGLTTYKAISLADEQGKTSPDSAVDASQASEWMAYSKRKYRAGVTNADAVGKSSTAIQLARNNPEQALTLAEGIQEEDNRIDALIGVASGASPARPSIARSALAKALNSLGEGEPHRVPDRAAQIAGIYRHELHDPKSADAALQKGIVAAKKLYERDTRSSAPNTAPKALWPSTMGWRSLLIAVAEGSPTRAVQLIQEIPDEQIRVIERVYIASALMKRLRSSTTMALVGNRERIGGLWIP